MGSYSHSRQWLAAEAELMDALVQSPALRAVMSSAAWRVRQIGPKRQRRGERGERYEAELAELITPLRSQSIGRDVLKRVRYTGLGELVGCSVVPVDAERRGPLDIWVEFEFADGSTHRTPVNVKCQDPDYNNGASRRDDAVSLRAFIYHLTTPGIDPWECPIPHSFSADRALLEMTAGVRKIQRGRSYWILNADVTRDGVLTGCGAFGLITHLNELGGLLIARSNTRDSILMYSTPHHVLPDDFQINQEIAARLLPRPDVERLRARTLAMLVTGGHSREQRDVARALLTMSDDDFSEALFAAFHPDH
jgi:hypothetical protein